MKQIVAFGIKEDGMPFQWIRPKEFKDSLDNAQKGKWRIIAERFYAKASKKQFAWLYGHVYPLSLIALNEAGYELTSVDNYKEVDNFWKIMFANKKLINRQTGEEITLPKNKAEFKTVDQMEYCNKIRDHCAEWFNTYIPEPNVNWKKEQDKLNKNQEL